eukprot:SAG31_NODE_777_length_12167_cov_6.570683_3_plen_79_part_00
MTLGSKTVPIKWMPQFKKENIVISFRIEADEIQKMENIRYDKPQVNAFLGLSRFVPVHSTAVELVEPSLARKLARPKL